MDDAEYEVGYKVLLLGDSAVGKTSMIKCLMGDTFNPISTEPTCGVDLIQKTFHVNGVRVLLKIWDTAGQERYKSITTAQFRDVQGVIMVYDITDKRSFDSIAYWLKMLQLEINNNKNAPVFLVGNKSDLDEKRAVTKIKGEQKIKDSSLVQGFLETSVKSNPYEVNKIFHEMARMLVATYDVHRMRFLAESGDYGSPSPTIKLNAHSEKKQEKRKCCHK